MREQERSREHENEWAGEMDRAQSPAVERAVTANEDRIRGEANGLADVRSEWAAFAQDNPVAGDGIQRDFVRAQNIAYARVVDDLLRQETGQGLREQRDEALMRDADDLMPRTDARQMPPAPGPQAAEARIEGDPREAVRQQAMDLLDQTRAKLEVLTPEQRASVQREADRLTAAVPLFSSREMRDAALVKTAQEMQGADDQTRSQLRTRLYALASIDPNRQPTTQEQPALEEARSAPRAVVEDDRPYEDRAPPTIQMKMAMSLERDVPEVTSPDLDTMRMMSDDFRSLGDDIRGQDDGRLRTDEQATLAGRVMVGLDRDADRPADTNPGRVSARAGGRERLENTSPGRAAPEQPGDTNPGRVSARAGARALPDNTNPGRVSARPFEEHGTRPGRRNMPAPGPEQERELSTVELNTRDFIIEEEDGRSARELAADATINTRLSERGRDLVARENRRLAGVAIDADREYLELTRAAVDDDGADSELRNVTTVLEQLRPVFGSRDPVDLAAKVDELNKREEADPEMTGGRLRYERLAYGVLCREAYESQGALLGRATKDRLQEIDEMSPQEKDDFVAEARVLLREDAYNDRHAMNRELLIGETDRIAQVAAVTRIAPALQELERQARWKEPAFHARVDRRVMDLLHTPERDGAIKDQLADARVRMAVNRHDDIERQLANEEAVELAEVLRSLPIARANLIETGPIRRLPNVQ